MSECPDCSPRPEGVSRRMFLKTASVAGAAAVTAGPSLLAAEAKEVRQPESVVKVLYETLRDKQKGLICHGWDYTEDARGLLRTRVANNWHINKYVINSSFYTKEQQHLIREVFEGIIHPDWHARIDKQLEDDAGGFGEQQNIAIFGKPGDGKFELVMTGRHMTLRCDGNSADHVAFGGPIFYGHAPDFNEEVGHPTNVYWHQAVAANKVYAMLDGKQRKTALVEKAPREQAVAFQGKDGKFTGIPVSDMSNDQREQVQKTLKTLLAPYRQSDRDEALKCLKTQGGLDKCHLTFYKKNARGQNADIGNNEIWDMWRLEGPSFVWHFRGFPHVHVWVNIAADASVKTNA